MSRRRNRPQPWTPAELELLRQRYADTPTPLLAQTLNRPVTTVYQRAYALGLAKSDEYLRSPAAGRIVNGGRDTRGVGARFVKGMVPWNKGVKGSTGTHPNSRRTQFKPGRLPQDSRNYLPIGSLRINADGYLERKVSDDRTLAPARRWVGVHRLVWEAAHGPVPAGCIVVFRGPRTTVLDEITLDRVECITRAEHANRNHPRSRHPELGRLAQLKGAITRQINRITREHAEQQKGQTA